MDKDLVQMVVRKCVTLAAGYFIAHGWLDTKDVTTALVETVSGALALVISLFWSRWHQKALKGGVNESKG